MFFLFRIAFWLCVVLVLLPTFAGTGSKQKRNDDTQVSASEAVSAASATVSDMTHFCQRQPEACAIGAQAAVVIGQKAQEGAKIVYDFISERNAPRSTGTVTTVPYEPTAAGRPSQHTLTTADLEPAWRGPRPQKDAKLRAK